MNQDAIVIDEPTNEPSSGGEDACAISDAPTNEPSSMDECECAISDYEVMLDTFLRSDKWHSLRNGTMSDAFREVRGQLERMDCRLDRASFMEAITNVLANVAEESQPQPVGG